MIVALLALALLAGLLVWAAAQPAPRRPRSQPLAVASPAMARSRSRDAAWTRMVMPCSWSIRQPVGLGNGITGPAGSAIGFSPDGTAPRLSRSRGERDLVQAARGQPPGCQCSDGSRAIPLTGVLALVSAASWSSDGRGMAVSFTDRTQARASG